MSGKFSDALCETLYTASLDGSDEEYGNCTEPPCRWWGLVTNVHARDADTGQFRTYHAILTEDSQGFVDYELFESAAAARSDFERIVAEVEAELGDVEP